LRRILSQALFFVCYSFSIVITPPRFLRAGRPVSGDDNA